jgi:hypothetical protein
LSVTDPDAGGSHVFSVPGGSPFEVSGTTLKLKAGQTLDFESTPSVTVDVTVTDQGALTRTETFTISVNNGNEPPADIALSGGTVAENAAGAAVGLLSVTDPDAGGSHVFSVPNASAFEVSGTTLKLKAGQALDFETTPSVTVDVTVTDQDGLTRTEAFTITVSNVNETPTDIALSGTAVADKTAGAAVGVLSVTDPDAGGSHAFSVPIASPFEVSGTTLKLKSGQALDFDVTPSVTVDVTVTDQGGLDRTEAFTITVSNGNDAPTDIALTGGSVAENAAGAVVGTLSVTDPDPGGSHVFSVPGGSPFEVSGTTLRLKAGQSLDFESTPSVTVDVTVTDQGALTRTETFTISVTNVNEAPSDIALSGGSIAENIAGGAVGTLSLTDPDAGGSHVFSVPNASPFEVAGTTLKLKAGQSLDFETASSVTVDVTVTDQGGLSRTEAFTVTVTNANDPPSDIALSNLSISEAAVAGTPGAVSATDPDLGQELTFQLDGQSPFELGSDANGVILRLREGEALDFETASSVPISITVTDQGGLSRTEAFTIAVTNTNDAPTASGDIGAGDEGVALTIQASALLANDSDPDGGDTLSLTTVGEAENGQVALSGGTVTFTPAVGYAGAARFRYTASDAGGLTASALVVLTIASLDRVITGNAVGETLTGFAGDDTISGLAGNDVIDGAAGSDWTSYGVAGEAVTVDLAAGIARGGSASGTDTLISIENVIGSGLDDVIFGSAGSNILHGGAGSDRLDGRDGSDTASYHGNVEGISVALDAKGMAFVQEAHGVVDRLVGIENIVGTATNDTLFGDSGSNRLEGGAGNDTIDGGPGNDIADFRTATVGITATLAPNGSASVEDGLGGIDSLLNIEGFAGGSGNDHFVGNAALNNFFHGRRGNDVIDGNGGFDIAMYEDSRAAITATLDSAGTISLADGMGTTDTLIGIDGLMGTRFADRLIGDAQSNFFRGGAGNDVIDGQGDRHPLQHRKRHR